MRLVDFVESCEYLGYPCIVNDEDIIIYKLYGEKMSQKMRIGWVSLKISHHFKMTLDPTSVYDGIGELICEFGQTSLARRGTIKGIKVMYHKDQIFKI